MERSTVSETQVGHRPRPNAAYFCVVLQDSDSSELWPYLTRSTSHALDLSDP